MCRENATPIKDPDYMRIVLLVFIENRSSNVFEM